MTNDTVPPALAADLETLARRYRRASGPAMEVLQAIGARSETLLDRLPDSTRANLDAATMKALGIAFDAAHRNRDRLPGADWRARALTTALGAAGGLGGLPGALVELPVTTTVLLRTIQTVAEEEGFDTTSEAVRFDCLEVLSAAGPLSEDDGADMGFLAARATLTGATVHGLIARIAPRLATALGQKLAAQTVPVIGAAAGAAVNYTFTGYYRDMARVSFGLRRAALDADVDYREALGLFASEVRAIPVKRAS